MEARNVKKSSTSSVQYLLYIISFDEEIATLRKNFISKNNFPHWVIKQILTQVEKQKKETT